MSPPFFFFMAFLNEFRLFFVLFLFAIVVHCQNAAAVHPPLFNRITPTNNESTMNLTLTQYSAEEKAAMMNTTAKMDLSTAEEKIQRLKELRNEMRALTATLKEERRQNKGKDSFRSRHRHHFVVDKMHLGISRQFRKWRKKVLSKIHSVMHRLDHLEGEMHRTKDNLQKMLRHNGREKGAKWAGGSKKRRPLSSHSADPIRRVQMQMSHRRGELGSVCQNHGECKPGHCCLRDAPMSTVPLAVGQGTGHCVRYAYNGGIACRHSCECSAQLLCFREHQQQKTNANSTSPTAVCKRASSSDLLNGVYENAMHAAFDHHEASVPGDSDSDVFAFGESKTTTIA